MTKMSTNHPFLLRASCSYTNVWPDYIPESYALSTIKMKNPHISKYLLIYGF
jgi:hypothetical protein